jgi:hypothetical protein
MSLIVARSPVTLRQTFSFYVSAGKPHIVERASTMADAVVVAGRSGPSVVQRLREKGWDAPVLFDAGSYVSGAGAIDATAWAEEQEQAGADRLLSPSLFVPWDSPLPSFEDFVAAELSRTALGATVVLSIDHRWLTKAAAYDVMTAALRRLDAPVGLVLADTGDPLGYQGAVNSLVALTTSVPKISILRTDHGGIGALAFAAAHESIGLTPTHRHAVPPGKTAFTKPHDQSKRVFVGDLMDWFTVATIAGWSTTRTSPTCTHPCCGGARIDRFFDERLAHQADIHNETVLAAIANVVLDAPEEFQRRIFGQMCSNAVERYGPMGNLVNEITPKSQLTQWAQFA